MKNRIGLLAAGIALATLGGCALEGDNGAIGRNGSDGADGAGQVIALTRVARTASQGFDEAAAEIVEYDAAGNRIFTVNAESGEVDVFDAGSFAVLNGANPAQSLDLRAMLVAAAKAGSTAEVGNANSLSVHGNLVAVAVEANPKTAAGWVVFLNAGTLAYVNAVSVGALPDMVAFTPDGARLLVANEGEPNEGYSVDPEGSVSVIDVGTFAITPIGFTDFNAGNSRNAELPAAKMVLNSLNGSVAQDLEPEYIAVSADGRQAYVSLQEANAIAVLDLSDNSVEKIIGLGFKDHSIPGNEFDASQRDGVNLKTWPVMGMYMPDTLSTFAYNGRQYVITANEGDSRDDWLAPIADELDCEGSRGYYFVDGECLDELALRDIADSDLVAGPALAGLDTDSTLGRLKFSYQATKLKNGGTTVNRLYAYGARSFAIWDAASGEQVFDSGSDFERITALRYGSLFNQNHNADLGDPATGDDRSDNKGPEPEALAVGRIGGHTYAFVGLERMGGIMVYDISNPFAPQFVQYVNERDVTAGPDQNSVAAGSDLGPESIKFVPAAANPGGKPLLIVGNEVSGTTSVYEIAVTALQE